MKKIQQVIGISLAVAAINTGCGGRRNTEQTQVASTIAWQNTPLIADGSDSEWVGSMAFYNEKAKLGYTISNDKNNVYVLLRTTYPPTQQQILRGGLTVLVNSHGVKDDHGAAGIVFPTGNLHQKNNMLAGRPELNSNIHIALDNAKDYSLYGFNTVKSVENYDIDKENPERIEVAIGLNASNALVYECVIPLTAIFNPAAVINPSGRNIAVGFIIDDIPGETGQGGRGGGVSVGGGLGFGSFGSGGGLGISIGTGALGGGRGRNGRINQTRIWREVMLAKVPK